MAGDLRRAVGAGLTAAAYTGRQSTGAFAHDLEQSGNVLSRRDREAIEAARVLLGRHLAVLRRRAGYSQHEFAPLTGYGRSTVANVETGRQSAVRGFWERCAEVLAARALVAEFDEISAMEGDARAVAQAEEQAARELRVPGWQAQGNGTRRSGMVPAEPGRLARVLARPGSADLVTVAGLREQLRALDARYDRSPATALIADAGACLGQISFLRSNAGRGDVRRELYGAEAEAAILMGQLVWDASQRRDQGTAACYFDQAIAAAQARGEAATHGLALLRKSMVALYGLKDPAQGRVLCEQVCAVSGRSSRVLTSLASLHAAESHAMLGDRRECERALSAADTQISLISADDPAIDLFSSAQPGRMAGSCYLFLGDAYRSALLLEETAGLLHDNTKAEGIVLGNLALAYIRQARIEEAVGVLHKALDVIEVNWGGGGLTVVFAAGHQLLRWQYARAVREFRDRLLTLMAAG